ncbi:MAG: high-potential iron-sulfur protein [Myxococcota bacterium]
MRRTLQYVEQTANQEQKCSNCAQFVADQYGDCGGCNVMTGPVQPNGYCLSWAALEAAPAEEAPAEPAGEAPAAEAAEG